MQILRIRHYVETEMRLPGIKDRKILFTACILYAWYTSMYGVRQRYSLSGGGWDIRDY